MEMASSPDTAPDFLKLLANDLRWQILTLVLAIWDICSNTCALTKSSTQIFASLST